MPREPIEIDCSLSRLSILDPDGGLDEELAPDLGDERMLELFRAMLRARRFDERLLELQRSGQIGTFAPVKGQEAAQIGAAAALEETDWLVPAFRELAASLWRGTSLTQVILYDAGYNEGGHAPEGTRTLPIAIPVASQLPHAAGIAYAAKLLGEEEVVLTFFGDGATSEGDFHEAVNFAGVFELPVVFVCQNNQWAISVPRERQTKSRTLAQKAVAYGIPGIVVDGNDVLAVYSATAEAVRRARNGKGPSLVECETYRLEVHTTADDPSRYRDEEEVEQWQRRDPIARFESLLRAKELLTDSELDRLEEEIGDEIASAWKDAKARISELDEPIRMFEHVYAETPPYLLRQRERVRSEEAGEGRRSAGEARSSAAEGRDENRPRKSRRGARRSARQDAKKETRAGGGGDG